MTSVIIGFGTGRCGTQSFAQLLMRQPNVMAMHEGFMAPWVVYDGAFYRNMIQLAISGFKNEIKPQSNQRLYYEMSLGIEEGDFNIHDGLRVLFDSTDCTVGDANFSWLNYLDKLFEILPNAKALCLVRDKGSCVESWMRIKRHNYWTDGTRKMCRYFPSYDLPEKEAIGQYWEDYNRIAEKIQKRHKRNVAIVPMDWMLNDARFQGDMLRGFLGIRDPVVDTDIRLVGDERKHEKYK